MFPTVFPSESGELVSLPSLLRCASFSPEYCGWLGSNEYLNDQDAELAPAIFFQDVEVGSLGL